MEPCPPDGSRRERDIGDGRDPTEGLRRRAVTASGGGAPGSTTRGGGSRGSAACTRRRARPGRLLRQVAGPGPFFGCEGASASTAPRQAPGGPRDVRGLCLPGDSCLRPPRSRPGHAPGLPAPPGREEYHGRSGACKGVVCGEGTAPRSWFFVPRGRRNARAPARARPQTGVWRGPACPTRGLGATQRGVLEPRELSATYVRKYALRLAAGRSCSRPPGREFPSARVEPRASPQSRICSP